MASTTDILSEAVVIESGNGSPAGFAPVFNPLVDHEQIPALPAGFVLSRPRTEEKYTLQAKLGTGGEGHSYLALDNENKKKVVKFVRAGTSAVASELEAALNTEYARLNSALHRSYTAFAVNHFNLAVVSDFVEGRNLEQELQQTGRAYTPAEAADFLLQVVEKQVKPLHDQKLVHRDLKPQNIICTTRDDRTSDYTIIDFGTLREHDALATVTMNLKGTPGYARFKGKYECQDDYYSLARVAYFLMTGKHPEFIAHEKYDKMHDEEVFSALPIDNQFQKMLFRMLGHSEKELYASIDDLVADLRKWQKKAPEKSASTSAAGIDLASAKKLTEYRESTVVSVELQRKINGLKERFKEQYSPTNRNRNPLQNDFLSDLEGVLSELGYREYDCVPPETEGKIYLRQRKESSKVDVLLLKNKGESKDYLRFFQIEDADDLKRIGLPFENSAVYGPIFDTVSSVFPWAVGFGMAVLGGYLGHEHPFVEIGTGRGGGSQPAPGELIQYSPGMSAFLGTLAGGLAGAILGTATHAANNKCYLDRCPPRFHEQDSYAYGLFGITLPHVIAKFSSQVVNGCRKMYHSVRRGEYRSDIASLSRALEPAPFFTYGVEKNSFQTFL